MTAKILPFPSAERRRIDADRELQKFAMLVHQKLLMAGHPSTYQQCLAATREVAEKNLEPLK
jgi:hypothetical protein